MDVLIYLCIYIYSLNKCVFVLSFFFFVGGGGWGLGFRVSASSHCEQSRSVATCEGDTLNSYA